MQTEERGKSRNGRPMSQGQMRLVSRRCLAKPSVGRLKAEGDTDLKIGAHPLPNCCLASYRLASYRLASYRLANYRLPD